MVMPTKKVAVIAGGDSSEWVVSVKSARQVWECLDRNLFDPYIVTMKGKEWKVADKYPIDKNDFSFTDENGIKTTLEYALVMIHGTPGENGILQGYFELLGIPYSTCGVEVSALTFDKSLCKVAVSGVSGINLAREILLRKGETPDADHIIERLGLPLFIKPNTSGSSFGVTKVKKAEDLLPAIERAFTESDKVIMEEFIAGREVSHGIMIIDGKEYILPITELISKNEFFDFEAKYEGLSDEITPADIPYNVEQSLKKTTLEVYKTLGCRGVVRIDYIIRDDKPYFIEVNTTPGMSANSIIPQQWREAGLSMGEAFTMIINQKSY